MGGCMENTISPDLKQTSLINIILKYNFQSLNLNNKVSCVGNFRLFYFNDYGNLDI